MGEFSSRTRDIERVKERLVAEYVAKHGRQPSSKVLWQIRQQATLETRPAKEHHSLAELTARWPERAATHVGDDPVAWARRMLRVAEAEPLLRADDLPAETIAELAEVVVAMVADRRSTWRRWNLHAEAVRQSMPWRFASAQDRDRVVGMITDAAEQASLVLTPSELASTPEWFTRSGGSSAFRPRNATVYSSLDILAAEAARVGQSAFVAPVPRANTVEVQNGVSAFVDHGLLGVGGNAPSGSGRFATT